MQPLKTFMPFELTNLSGNSPQINEGYWSVCKTLNNLLFAEIILIGQSSSKSLGSSSRSVIEYAVF